MKKIRRSARWLVVLGILVFLAACGQSTPGGGARPPVLSDADHQLQLQSQLPGGRYDAQTSGRVWIYRELNLEEYGPRSYSTELYEFEGGEKYFPVGSDGDVGVVLDARKMKPLNARDLALLRSFDYSAGGTDDVSVRVSDPEVRFRALSNIYIYQSDPAGTGSSITSDQSYFWLLVNDSYRAAWPVFSDRWVTINTSFPDAAGMVEVMEANFVPGWNLLVEVYDQDRQAWINSAVPFAELGFLEFEPGITNVALMPSWIDAAVGAFLEHQLGGDGAATLLDTRSGSSFLYVTDWLGFAGSGNPDLVPLSELFASASEPALSSNSANGAAAAHILYDRQSLTDRWWSDPAGGNGRFIPTTSAGNDIMILYSDRSTSLQVQGAPLSYDGSVTLRTSEAGLELAYGWNHIELIPDPDDETVLIMVPWDDGDAFTPENGYVVPLD